MCCHVLLLCDCSVQKQRATRSEDALEHLNAQVLEREQGLLDLRAEHDRLQTNHDKLLKERAKLENARLQLDVEHLKVSSSPA